MKSVQKTSKNLKETSVLAKKFLYQIVSQRKRKSGATVVGLSGNLGAGKTAFIKEIGRHLKIKAPMSSPTFVIIKRYSISHQVFENFFHLDAYRLKNVKELLRLGWEEIISNEKNLVFIDWPENVREAMPRDSFLIEIWIDEKGERNFKLE
jgi:tRNA threonylcarbamoyladenosine biosynthesis protein TsaE